MARFFSGSVPASLMTNGTLPNNTFPVLQSQLVILKAKTHSDEVLSKNGIQRTVYIVVKNSPFNFQLGATTSSGKVDFHQIAFEVHLLYDCEGDKEVDFIKQKPIEYKCTPNEIGDRLDVEMRIKVLTSQHEDMLFKIRVQGYNPLTKEEIPGMHIISAPIKVISKPEQIKKRQPSKKRTLTDMLVETVSRIEAKQEEQQKLISKLLQQQNETTTVLDKKQKNTEPIMWEQENISEQEQSSKDVPFEEAFSNLINAYNAMTAEEKPETIRKLIRNSSTRDTERLSELLDLFWTEGLQKELGTRAVNNRDHSLSSAIMKGEDGCSCLDCPHKQELERIDEFYKEFLSSGVAIPPNF